METDHIRKEKLADPSAEFVVKLEPPWYVDEDTPDQPSAVYSTAQPMSDNTSLLSLDSKHPCYLCPAAFVLVSSLELHLASVHGEKLYVVLPGSSTPDRCDDGNCSNTNIDKEVDSHGNRKTTIKYANNNDTGDKDGKNRRQYVCDVCAKSFSVPSHLKRHKLIHSGVKSYVCDVCSKGFSQASSLTKHKRVHTGERPYKCPHCDRDFKESGHFQLHIMSVHEGVRPHVCDVCGAAFSKTSSLTVHRRIHTGEKPCVCSDCGKSFADYSTLRQHCLTHTGEKSHVCSDCGKCFARPSTLTRHRLTHSGQKPHSCPQCPSSFRYSQQLKAHIQSEHQ